MSDTFADLADVARLIARHDAHAPRYTSYPTAAQFTGEIGAETWADWLAAAPLTPSASLYLHVPFCKRLCWYCGCNTRAVNRADTISAYIDLLLREADLVLEATGRPVPVGAIHFGGGTPNMMSPDDLHRLFEGLAARFDFGPLGEIAMEMDPEVLTDDFIAACGRIGLTRASLGVQDLSPDVQAAVNRPESFASIQRAVEALRDKGVTSVNLDLMYGLPRQGVAEILDTLHAVTTLRPERLALFGYAHVPWMKPHQKLIHEDELPGAEVRFAQARAAEAFLIERGWDAIGLDHFALPHDSLSAARRAGRLRRNFQGYVTDEAPTLIGLGSSSISRTPMGHAQNTAVERDWRAVIAAGRLAVTRGVALSDRDRLIGEAIERLMCDFVLDIPALLTRHARVAHELGDLQARLKPFAEDGLIITSPEGLMSVTPRGRPFVRAVCAAFDPHALHPAVTNEKRHARVV